MSYKFTASILKEGKWYVARAIELGVVSQGKTLKEAQKNLTEAVELYLEDDTGRTKTKSSKETPIFALLEAHI